VPPQRASGARVLLAALALTVVSAALPHAPAAAASTPLRAAQVAADDDLDDAPLTSDDIYDEDAVAQVRLTITPGHLADLRARPDKYVAADLVVTVGGEEHGPYAIGARLKGTTSYRDLDGKAAWKLKFGYTVTGQTLFGLSGMTLNNMVQDPTMFSEALAYRLFRELDVPAPRTGYAYVTVNGAEYGLYANIEAIDATMAARWFASTQHVFEGGTGVDVTPASVGDMEVDEGSKSDRADLQSLVDVAASDLPDWAGAARSVADLDEMTRMWAVEHFVHHWDGYSMRRGSPFPSNYYLHSTIAGLFSMVPSGTDQTWAPSPTSDFGEVGSGVLIQRCVGDPTCRAAYLDAVDEVADTAAGLDLAGRAAQTAALIQPWVQRDPRREVSLAEVGQAQAVSLQMMGGRVAQARAWLAVPTFVLVDGVGGGSGGGGGGGSGAGTSPATATAPAAAPAIEPADVVPASSPATAPAPRAPMTAAQLAALSGPALAGLPPAELAAANPSVWSVLRARQARYLTLAQLRALPPMSVRRMPPAAVGALSARQLSALTPAALRGLRPAQVRALSPALRRLVSRLSG
jgi:hypothetical protein